MRHATITLHDTLTFGQPFRSGCLAEPGVPRARPDVADRARRVLPSIGRCTVIVDRSRHCPSLLPASAYGYAKRSSVVAAHPQLPRRVTRLDAPAERRERLVNPFGQMRHRWGVNRVQRRTFGVHDGDAPPGVIPIRRARFVVPHGLAVRQRIVVRPATYVKHLCQQASVSVRWHKPELVGTATTATLLVFNVLLHHVAGHRADRGRHLAARPLRREARVTAGICAATV
ncbi:hypothetical protein Cagg_2411 [Chloroflexus aggregans DSM 9485]|uniref:Uncharacterized protein n=1 Tax=Chloroflexus aggregans (strain MD-66 / DSM 9485) TaxID=326427 RepID=B8G3B1_CHLAD|nr:hypothetical protein Cagg_2411 [Chloroflexus aggregans DSM 9485]